MGFPLQLGDAFPRARGEPTVRFALLVVSPDRADPPGVAPSFRYNPTWIVGVVESLTGGGVLVIVVFEHGYVQKQVLWRGERICVCEGMKAPVGDAFLRAWPEPLPSLRSVQGLELTLILQESPQLPLPSYVDSG
ncbi:hypothetical protein CSV70_14770, partial [Sporosarcina sp. P25]